MVTEGVLRKNATIVVRRGKRVVFDGLISSLRRVKEIVNEARLLPAARRCVSCSDLTAEGLRYECACGVDGVTDFTLH